MVGVFNCSSLISSLFYMLLLLLMLVTNYFAAYRLGVGDDITPSYQGKKPASKISTKPRHVSQPHPLDAKPQSITLSPTPSCSSPPPLVHSCHPLCPPTKHQRMRFEMAPTPSHYITPHSLSLYPQEIIIVSTIIITRFPLTNTIPWLSNLP